MAEHLLTLLLIVICTSTDIPPVTTSQEITDNADSSLSTSFLSRPHSVSVALVSWSPPVIRVQWLYGSTNRIQFPARSGSKPMHDRIADRQTSVHRLGGFELSYQAKGDKYRLVLDLPSSTRSVRLEGLRSGAEYDLYLAAVSEQGLHNRSAGIRFLAPRTENESSVQGPLSPQPAGGHSVTVREEEIIIVALVLIVWVAVILLFFNKWGKIRMLEPYQPEYRDPPPFPVAVPKLAPRVSGGGNMEAMLERERFSPVPAYSFMNRAPGGSSRPRQNSVFVGSPYMYSRTSLTPGSWNMPRKVKSAEDIKSLVVQITQCDVETSVL